MPASSGDDRPTRVPPARRPGARLLLAALALVVAVGSGAGPASASGSGGREDRPGSTRADGSGRSGGPEDEGRGSGGGRGGSGEDGSGGHGSGEDGEGEHGSGGPGSGGPGSGGHGSGEHGDDDDDAGPTVPVVGPAETPTAVVVPVAPPAAETRVAGSVEGVGARGLPATNGAGATIAPPDRSREAGERAEAGAPAGGTTPAPPPSPSGVEPPLGPLVPDGGWGWGIVGALVAAAVAGFVVRHATLRGAIREAQRSATRDPLTGLANRRLFDEILARELLRSRRRATPLALLVVDLDGFKRVNDTRGHAAGDGVLRTVADTLAGRVRGSDLPARLGGDEFAVVLTECSTADARRIGETLAADIATATGSIVTASVGVAGAPEHAEEANDLMAAADAALYRAKAEGRNRVVLAGSEVPPAA